MILKHNPKVSVVIPTYNSAKYLRFSIESVINQTYKNIEIIVVDDGSNDSTKDIIRKYKDKIIYVEKEHSGISPTVNVGIKQSSGELLSFLDADDLWYHQKLEKQIDFLIANSDIDMVFSQITNFNDQDKHDIEYSDSSAQNTMAGYSRNTILIWKKQFLKVGYFSEEYKTGEFIEWYLRSKNKRLIGNILPDILAKRRIHTTNTTLNRSQLGADYIQILKKSIDQKRNKS